MNPYLVVILFFLALAVASLGCLTLYERLPVEHRQDDTHNVVKLAASVFAVMASLVLGLLISSAKNQFETIDRSVHAFATELLLFDRTLRFAGPETADTRRRLVAYVQRALDNTWPTKGGTLVDDRVAEHLLDEVDASLKAVVAKNTSDADLWRDAQQHLNKIVELRLHLIQSADGTIPTPVIAMLGAWLVMIFASFGYRAPKNPVVVTTLLVSSFLVAVSLYLILDMDVPFSGPIRVSPAPLQRVIEQMKAT